MPKFERGDMFANWTDRDKDHYYLFTANNLVNNGKLVMGAGTAALMKLFVPDSPKLFGEQVTNILSKKQNGWYGLILLNDLKIGAFQTKMNPYEDSDPSLIRFSIECLVEVAINQPYFTFNLPYPGIGFGNLSKETVEPMLAILPDNVIVWER